MVTLRSIAFMSLRSVCEENSPRVDVSGLVAGIVAILVSAGIATVLGIYCYKNKKKSVAGSAR